MLSGLYRPRSGLTVSASLGYGFLGTLRLEDPDGVLLQEDEYDAAFTAGLGVELEL